MRSFLRLLKLHKLAVRELDVSRGGLTQCHGVLDHGLNVHRDISLMKSLSFFSVFALTVWVQSHREEPLHCTYTAPYGNHDLQRSVK